MNDHLKKKTVGPQIRTPAAKSLRHSNRKISQKPPPASLDLQKNHAHNQASSNTAAPSCPYCGGWIIVEWVMDFYHPQTLQKCLNCGRILVNPFLPLTVRHLPPLPPVPPD